jgi:exportin-5
MLEAAELASSQPLTEANYNFLKRLTEVLVGMGTQLCGLYGKEPDVTKPETFAMYLQAVLALTRHPSLSINQTTASLWVALFKHERLNPQPELLAVIEPWIGVVARKFVKTPACAYDGMDFDSDEEFTSFHQRLRADLVEAVRLATVLAPSVTFCYAQQWLLSQLDNPNSVLSEWEALSLFLDAVACKAKEAPSGPQLLERCLVYQSTDPAILSELLSCISALFVYVHHDPQRLLQPVLDRIFSSVLFSGPGQSKDNRTKIVRNVRRHACSLMVKISMQHPGLLAQQFDYVKSSVERLSKTQDDSQLSRMEVVTLQEALLIISNQFTNFQMQCDLIGEVIRPAVEQWTAMSPAFNSAQEFMSFIGLDRPPVEPSAEDVHGRNRSELLASASVFWAVLKRCKTSTDPLKGHPAAQHLAPLLFHTFRLARVLHQLWEPEAQKLLSPGFAKAYDLLESEIVSILAQGGMSQSGMPACISQLNGNVQKQQTPLERVQSFLVQIHNNVFIMLGSFGETLGEQFYATPGLAVAVAGTTCGQGMEYIPDCRLRTVVKVFCRPFINSCPAQLYQPVLLPFLAYFLPAMLQRLSGRWQQTMQQQRDENQANLQEILCDVVVRLATRDYIELLRSVTLSISSQFPGEENEEMMDAEVPSSGGQMVASVSELGKMVLAEPSLCGHLLQFLLSSLWWPDSGNSLKATNILESIVKYWAGLIPRNSSLFPNSEVASLCLSHLLNGIQLLGQHDSNLSSLIHLGVLMYDTFLPIYPAVMSELMMRNAGCSREDADQYQDKAASLAAAGGQKINQKMERSKRELFRKMTSQVTQHFIRF